MDNAEIEVARQKHVGRLLLYAHRDFNSRWTAHMQALGFDMSRVSSAHIALIAFIEIDGTRLTTLAQRAGMTKQSVGQFIGELESAGLVARRPDPGDKRVVIVVFTAHGRQIMTASLMAKEAVEAEYRALLGGGAFAQLCAALERIADGGGGAD